MAKFSPKVATDTLREEYLTIIIDALEKADYEVLRTDVGTIYLPAVDINGEERWVKFSTIIPKASEEDGTDGYALAEAYRLKVAERAEKAKAKEAEKQAKIVKDKAKRSSKADKHPPNED